MAGMVIQCVCGAISGQSLPIITCNENKLLPDHQHSLAGTCSVFTTFIIRCLSFTQSSHKVQSQASDFLQRYLVSNPSFPSVIMEFPVMEQDWVLVLEIVWSAIIVLLLSC